MLKSINCIVPLQGIGDIVYFLDPEHSQCNVASRRSASNGTDSGLSSTNRKQHVQRNHSWSSRLFKFRYCQSR